MIESVKRFIGTKLKLKVNESKSAVAKPQERNFLGFSFTGGKELKRKIAPKAIGRFKERVREIMRKSKGMGMETVMEELADYRWSRIVFVRLVSTWPSICGAGEAISDSAKPLRGCEVWIRGSGGVFDTHSGDSGA